MDRRRSEAVSRGEHFARVSKWERPRGGSEKEALSLALALSEGRWSHDFPITVEAARELGLTVSTDMLPILYELWTSIRKRTRSVPRCSTYH